LRNIQIFEKVLYDADISFAFWKKTERMKTKMYLLAECPCDATVLFFILTTHIIWMDIHV
jgi:hypothetical protein